MSGRHWAPASTSTIQVVPRSQPHCDSSSIWFGRSSRWGSEARTAEIDEQFSLLHAIARYLSREARAARFTAPLSSLVVRSRRDLSSPLISQALLNLSSSDM